MEPVSGPQAAQHGAPPSSETPTYVDFLCLRVDPEFRRLSRGERVGASAEFLAAAREAGSRIEVRPYLTLGFRADCDFLLWLIAKDLAAFQPFVSAMVSTQLGKYLDVTYAWIGMTKSSPYFKGHKQRFEMGPSTAKYLFVYPFTKSHAWYQLSYERRRELMSVHNEIGHKFPGVLINTCYQFGLGDHDFLLAFECDDPKEFSDLVQKLRETEARIYTTTDIPLIPGVRHSIDEVVQALALS